MNILLLNPKTKHPEKLYPLGLGYLASVLKKEGNLVWGIDDSFSRIKQLSGWIKKNRIGLVVIWMTHQNIDEAIYLSGQVKECLFTLTIAVGPHAAIAYKGADKNIISFFDFVSANEAEIVLPELVYSVEKKQNLFKVGGLVWKNGEEITVNPGPRIIEKLDELPFPDRDIFPLERYTGMIGKNRRYTQILTSRGCNNKCLYCPEPYASPAWRKRSPKNIVDEIESVIDKYGIREFHIEDANLFGGDPGRVKGICAEMLERNVHICWQCTGGIPLGELTDPSIIDFMAEAGCYNISLGVESFKDMTTQLAGRKQNSDLIRAVVERCKRQGVELSCHLIMGFPGQSLEDIRYDIHLSRNFSFDFIHYNVFNPIPGLGAQNNNKAGDAAAQKDLSCCFPDRRILERMQRLAYLSLCFKPSILRFIVRRLLSFKLPIAMLKKAYYYIFGKQHIH